MRHREDVSTPATAEDDLLTAGKIGWYRYFVCKTDTEPSRNPKYSGAKIGSSSNGLSFDDMGELLADKFLRIAANSNQVLEDIDNV